MTAGETGHPSGSVGATGVALATIAESVCVRYLDALAEPELVGTEAWLSADEVIAIDMGTHAEGRT
jgi:hypothetical protein